MEYRNRTIQVGQVWDENGPVENKWRVLLDGIQEVAVVTGKTRVAAVVEGLERMLDGRRDPDLEEEVLTALMKGCENEARGYIRMVRQPNV